MSNTKTRVLNEARNLVQARGYNAFSLQDLAAEVGIKKPSLYDHFKSKEDIGKSLVESYLSDFTKWTETISVFDPKAQIGALFEAFAKFIDESRVCPLAALSSECNSFPKSMKSAVKRLSESRFDWLKAVIVKGQKSKEIRKDKSADDLAMTVLSLGIGSQLMARATMDAAIILKTKNQVMELLKPEGKL